MYKVGATFRDKNKVRELHQQGRTPEQITQLTRISPAHVKAILDQVKAGTLHMSGAAQATAVKNEAKVEAEVEAAPEPAAEPDPEPEVEVVVEAPAEEPAAPPKRRTSRRRKKEE